MRTRLSSLSLITGLALASTSPLAIAQTYLDGEERTVTTGEPSRDWIIRNSSTLNVEGSAWDVQSNSSTVNIDGGSIDNLWATQSIVNANGGTLGSLEALNSVINASGLTVNGQVTLRNGSTVANFSGVAIENATGIGLVIANDASAPGGDLSATANLSGSSVAGVGFGASIASGGILNLAGTRVHGSDDGRDQPYFGGFGVRLIDGTVNLRENSYISGDKSGLLIFEATGNSTDTRSAIIDGSTVEGLTGAAISVVGVEVPSGIFRTDADILVQNGSRLIGGNGNILEVDQYSTARFTVDNSALDGDIVVEEGGSADVVLQNNASLKGQITGVEKLSLNSGGTWQMIADGGVTNLSMDGGAVEISDGSGDQFNTLTVENLSGSGTFVMGTNLGLPEGDLLVVTGDASGDHMLHVKNTGAEPTVENALTVVDTNGGDATFDLVGGAVDLGVYKYLLEQQGNDWVLVGTKDITPGTATVIGMFSTAPTIWYGEAASLRSRMGDLRLGTAEGGIWTRTYGNNYNVKAGAGQAYDQEQWGMTVGFDRPIAIDNGQFLVGAFGGYSKSDIKFDVGTSGKIDSYYAGAYATWMGQNGLYVDGLVKVNRFANEANVIMSDGARANGDYSNYGFGGQIEVGKYVALGDRWFVEPYAQLSGVRAGGKDYWLDNGMHADSAAMNSFVGRIGTTIGLNHTTASGGVIQPYLKLAVAHEFAKNNKVFVNDEVFNNDLSGTRAEVGFGVAAQLTQSLQLHGDIDYSNGKNIEQRWGANVGLRYAF